MAVLFGGLGGAAGFGEGVLGRNDDGSTGFVDIRAVFENGLNFFGRNYTGFYVNNNGSVTFNTSLYSYTPTTITSATTPGLFGFWGDVDTRGGALTPTAGGLSRGTNLVYYDIDTRNDRVVITWDDVGYFFNGTDRANAFQIVLIDLSDRFGYSEGDFLVQYRYEAINWTTGSASGGSGGLGGQVARAGWSSGNGSDFFELPGSGVQSTVLGWDTNAGNTGLSGQWEFYVASDRPEVELASRSYAITGGGAEEGAPVTFVVTRSGDLSQASQVLVTLGSGPVNPATAGLDYVGSSNITVRFGAGQSRATVEVPTLRDGVTESNEFIRAQLIVTDPAGIATNASALGVIRNGENDDAGFDSGDFILSLQGGSWRAVDGGFEASGGMQIRHEDGPVDVAYILNITSARSYRVENGVLTVSGANLSFAPMGYSQATALAGVNFDIDLETGAISWRGRAALDLPMVGFEFASGARPMGASLERDALVINPDIRYVSWLSGINVPFDLAPELRVNSNGISAGGDLVWSLPGPYNVNVFNVLEANATGVGFRYHIGRADTFSDDALYVRGQFRFGVTNLGMVKADFGTGVDRPGLGGEDENFIMISDRDGDGDIDTTVRATVLFSSTGNTNMSRFDRNGLTDLSVTFDNTGGDMEIDGRARIVFGGRALDAEIGLVIAEAEGGTGSTGRDTAGEGGRLRLDSIKVTFTQEYGGLPIGAGVFLNSGGVGVENLANDRSVTLSGQVGGFWQNARLVSFDLSASFSREELKLTGNINMFKFGEGSYLASLRGSIETTYGESVKISGSLDFARLPEPLTVTFDATYRSARDWEMIGSARLEYNLSWRGVRALLSGEERTKLDRALNADDSGDRGGNGAFFIKAEFFGQNTRLSYDYRNSIIIGIDRPNNAYDGYLRYDFDTGLFSVEIGRKVADKVSGIQSALRNDATRVNTQGWQIEEGDRNLVLRAEWENASDNARLIVITPTGQRIREADFAEHGIRLFDFRTTDTARAVLIRAPDEGLWDVRLASTRGLGEVDYGATTSFRAAEMEVRSIAVNAMSTTIRHSMDLNGNEESLVTVYALRGRRLPADIDLDDAIMLDSAAVTRDGNGRITVSTIGLSSGTWRLVAEVSAPGVAPELVRVPGVVRIEGNVNLQAAFVQDSADVVVGDGLRQQLVLTNAGNRDARGVTLDFSGETAELVRKVIYQGRSYDAEDFRLSRLAAGDSVTVTVVLASSDRRASEGLTATITGRGAERVTQDNADTLTVSFRDPLYDRVGTAGADRLNIDDYNGVLRGRAGHDRLDGAEGDDLLFGDGGNDRLYGRGGDDYMTGGRGNDWLLGAAGNDRLHGEAGADLLRGGAGNEVLNGGAGRDTAIFGGAANMKVSLVSGRAIGATEGDDRLVSIENVTTGRGNDRLTGDEGHNRLNGGAGRDVLTGGAGNDWLIGGRGVDTARFTGPQDVRVDLSVTRVQDTGHGRDRLTGIENVISGAGDDALLGNGRANVLNGGRGGDTLQGAGGADRLLGGAGRDVIEGGAGRDIALGGRGADIFVFAEARHIAKGERIADFRHGQDRIDLSALDLEFIGTARFGRTEGEARFASGRLFIDMDGDGRTDHAIALPGVRVLTADDLIL